MLRVKVQFKICWKSIQAKRPSIRKGYVTDDSTSRQVKGIVYRGMLWESCWNVGSGRQYVGDEASVCPSNVCSKRVRCRPLLLSVTNVTPTEQKSRGHVVWGWASPVLRRARLFAETPASKNERNRERHCNNRDFTAPGLPLVQTSDIMAEFLTSGT